MPDRCLVGFCRVDLCVDGCRSLKDKRRIIRSLKDRLHNQFNVAVCEYGGLDLWQRAEIAMVSCANARDKVAGTLNTALRFVDDYPAVTLLHQETRIFDAS